MKRIRAAILAVVSAASLAGFVSPADAHPMGNFSINHYSSLTVDSRGVQLLYIIDMAEIPTFQEMSSLNVDRAGLLTASQRAAYLHRKAVSLAGGLRVTFDGKPVRVRLRASDILFPPGAGGLPTERLYLVVRASLPLGAGTLRYTDQNFSGRAGWKEIVVGGGRVYATRVFRR